MSEFRPRFSGAVLGTLGALLTVGMVTGGALSAHAADAPVGLGSADTFAVLGAAEVTNIGSTVVSGDIGVNPGSSITGFAPGVVTDGTIHTTDALSLQAQADLITAYDDASARTPVALPGADLTGLSLTPGVYSGGALEVNGELTLVGDKDSVFIFQAASSLVTGSNSKITLSGDISACNVFWRVPSSATLGSNSQFVGTVMAVTSVTANTGATIAGRLLARTAAVTLDTNVITRPIGCAPLGGGGIPGDGTGGTGGTGEIGTGDTGTVGAGVTAGSTAVSPTAAQPMLAETGSNPTLALLVALMLAGGGILVIRRARADHRTRA